MGRPAHTAVLCGGAQPSNFTSGNQPQKIAGKTCKSCVQGGSLKCHLLNKYKWRQPKGPKQVAGDKRCLKSSLPQAVLALSGPGGGHRRPRAGRACGRWGFSRTHALSLPKVCTPVRQTQAGYPVKCSVLGSHVPGKRPGAGVKHPGTRGWGAWRTSVAASRMVPGLL